MVKVATGPMAVAVIVPQHIVAEQVRVDDAARHIELVKIGLMGDFTLQQGIFFRAHQSLQSLCLAPPPGEPAPVGHGQGEIRRREVHGSQRRANRKTILWHRVRDVVAAEPRHQCGRLAL